MKQPTETLHTDPIVAGLAKRIAAENGLNPRTDPACADELALAVSVACAYVRAMVDELDAPFVLERNPSKERALGPVLFDSRPDALESMRKASRVKEVFTSSNADECFFILTMHRREYHVFGSEVVGDMIKRDVLQQAVEFGDHNFSSAAGSMQDLSDKLVENVVLYLAGLAPRRKRENDRMRAEYMRSEELLKAQMKTLQHALMEHRPFGAAGPLHSKLAQGEQELAGLAGKVSTLSATESRACLKEIQDILLSPQDHVHLERVEMRVGDFGVKTDTGKLVRFHECCYGDGERLAVFLATLSRETAAFLWPELAPPQDRT
jgi:hypothetical protein